MFTGIVEAIGTITHHSPSSTSAADAAANPADAWSIGGVTLTIHTPSPSPILIDAQLGDSISCNGVCLTITHLSDDQASFTVGLAPETLRRTTFGLADAHAASLVGSGVNLERACTAMTKLGGHMVQGHVDGRAKIVARTRDGDSVRLRFAADAAQTREQGGGWMRWVVEKGFVCVDGASLTVTAVGHDEKENVDWFEVMLVSYTQEKIVTARKQVGDWVNVEVDQMGKYVEKSVEGFLKSSASSGGVLEQLVERVLERKLKEMGIGR